MLVHLHYQVATRMMWTKDTGSGGRDLKGTKLNPKNIHTAPQTLTGLISMALMLELGKTQLF
jgi:hypothetical protein